MKRFITISVFVVLMLIPNVVALDALPKVFTKKHPTVDTKIIPFPRVQANTDLQFRQLRTFPPTVEREFPFFRESIKISLNGTDSTLIKESGFGVNIPVNENIHLRVGAYVVSSIGYLYSLDNDQIGIFRVGFTF